MAKPTSVEIVNQPLRKVIKSTGIIFFAVMGGMFLTLLRRILIVRFFTQSEYGIFCLGYAIFSIFATVSLLGLQDGIAREIGYYRGKNDSLKVRGIVFSSIQIVFIASVTLSLILFFTSNVISTNIFHDPELVTPLKVFAFAISFFALTSLLVSIFRGFESVKEKVYLSILKGILFLLFLLPVIFFGLPFINVIYAFTASIVVTCVFFLFYAIKRPPLPLRGNRENHAINPIGKELLFFSIPLVGVFMLSQIMYWTDTLILGFFKASSVVGLYNGTVPLARFMGVILSSVIFIYTPVTSQLYSKNQLDEINRNYKVLTRWIFSATLPIFLIFFLFPEVVLNFLFGSRYIEAATVLQILAIGFFVHCCTGTSGSTLIVMGKTKFLMWGMLITVVANIILNIVLIPIIGIVGAALATTLALVIKNVFWLVKLYFISKIQPFTKIYLKPVVVSIPFLFLIYILTNHLASFISFWILPLFLILFLVVYGLSILFTKSFDQEDISMLVTIEGRLGLNLTGIKNILKRFN